MLREIINKLVNKYGITNWNKISIILNRKYNINITSKECKEVYDNKEYISIDVNLLLNIYEEYPNQWNTISDVISKFYNKKVTNKNCYKEYLKIIRD
ncbi:hypothetical protein A0H76_20 [Hepatospora eriocheir]|nr:hypothetical protein A0H76_20 [Hepatospora eriocheir]